MQSLKYEVSHNGVSIHASCGLRGQVDSCYAQVPWVLCTSKRDFCKEAPHPVAVGIILS